MNSRTKVVILIVVAVVIVAGAVSYIALTPSSSPSSPSKPSGPAVCSASDAAGGAGNWTTYHQDNVRTGVEGSSNLTHVTTEWTSPTGLDADVYAEPLVCGNTVYVATEDNTVYAVNATTGTVIWQTNLGTPVQSNTLPCGDIGPTTGITGTPVIDVATGVLYAVAFLSPDQHVLFGLDVTNGTIVSHVGVDPAGAEPTVQQQRGALTLANGYVYLVYGGLDGDCGNYHGWVVGVPTSGSGGIVSYQVPTHREGGIWGTAGTAVAANGDLFVATGNGDSTTTFDYGDAVIELSPTLTVVGYFAPTNWAQLNSGDVDLGSVAPTLLPNGDVFQIGKAGEGYLLSGTDLGGIGGQITNTSVCDGAYGATAHLGDSIFVPCLDGVFDVVANATNLSVAWQSSTSFDAGSPIVTGNIVWSVDISNADLLGFNLSNGQQLFSFPLGAADHFISPSAAPGSLYVAGGSQLYAFSLD